MLPTFNQLQKSRGYFIGIVYFELPFPVNIRKKDIIEFEHGSITVGDGESKIKHDSYFRGRVLRKGVEVLAFNGRDMEILGNRRVIEEIKETA